MHRTIAPLVLAGLLSACSLANDLSELEGSAGTDGGAGASGGSAGADAGSNPCESACQRVALASCDNDGFSICLAECNQQASQLPSQCRPAWTALLECMAQSGSFVCDDQGKADLLNCSAEQSAFEACAAPDAGGTGGSAGSANTGGVGGAGCLASGASCTLSDDCCSLECVDGKCK